MTLLGTRKGVLGFLAFFALGACTLSPSSPALAAPLDSLLVTTYTGTAPTAQYIGFSGPRTVAVSFLTGSQNFTLSAFTARLTSVNSDDKATVTATLLNDDGLDRPGTALANFSNQLVFADGDAVEDVRFTTSSAYTLTSDTKYWVALKVVSGQGAAWEILQSTAGSSGSGTALDSISVNDGSYWESQSGTGRFAVEGVAVDAVAAPEPGTITLLLTASLPITSIIGIARRRKH